MKATYQPIKRGMTEAVTRGELEAAEREGREPVANVKQLTWFDTLEYVLCVFGVVDGIVYSWYENGRFSRDSKSTDDIFALPRYEWKFAIVDPSSFGAAMLDGWYKSEDDAKIDCKGWRVERIEGSKRLVKE